MSSFKCSGYGGADSILAMLYECHNANDPYDNKQIRADFEVLCQRMNGMPPQEVDRVIYPVCTLCHDHEMKGDILYGHIRNRIPRKP